MRLCAGDVEAKNQRESAMNSNINRKILLIEKPTGKLGPEHFRLVEDALPTPKEGEALVRAAVADLAP